MIGTVFFTLLAVVAAGLAIKYWIDHTGDDDLFTWFEFVVGSILCAVLVVPLVTWIGFNIARGSQATYNEYWSGFEKEATVDVTKCYRDGSCRYTYSCDPYTVQVPHTRTVGTGTNQRTETYYTTETRYHQCPYVEKEYTFKVTDTLGETYTFGDHWFPENPGKHTWRDGHGLPDVPSGQPRNWLAAKERIDSGNPGGTTKREEYKNYILASKDDIYAKSSTAIAQYKKAGVLPKVTAKVHDHYLADKVYGAPSAPGSTGDWQAGLMRLNGRIGSELQGDLHLVLVDAVKVPDADEYAQALEAYWQSDDLGRDTLSKNGLVVIVGHTSGAVTWARAFTGMPQGNEGLAVAVRENLTGVEATPETLLPAVGTLVFAPQPEGYKRVAMESFSYLFATVQPSTGQKILISFIAFLLSMTVWGAAILFDIRVPPFIQRLNVKRVTD